MNPSLKWKQSKCSGDQVVPDIDFESKLDKRKPFAKAFDDRLTARHTTAAPVNSSPVNGGHNSSNNRSYHRNQYQTNGHHNDKNHSIAALDEFWEERYSRILTHNIFNNNNLNHLNEAK